MIVNNLTKKLNFVFNAFWGILFSLFVSVNQSDKMVLF